MLVLKVRYNLNIQVLWRPNRICSTEYAIAVSQRFVFLKIHHMVSSNAEMDGVFVYCACAGFVRQHDWHTCSSGVPQLFVLVIFSYYVFLMM